jgi:hypothetical protein
VVSGLRRHVGEHPQARGGGEGGDDRDRTAEAEGVGDGAGDETS